MSRSPLPRAEAVARQFLARRPAHRLPWRWDASMALVGLGHLMAVSPSARTRHLGDLQDYQTTHLRTRSIALADHCLGAQSSLFLLRWRDDAEARFATQRVVDYLRTAPENDLGVLDHLGRHAWYRRLLRPGAWVDSMMMYVVTAAKVGAALELSWLEQMAVRHAERFCEHLQTSTGLFRHAKLMPDQRAPVHWLRGNGWAAVCLVELAGRSRVLDSALQRQAEALLDAQASNGLWPTIVDAPTSAHETSGSALVAYALAKAVRKGVLGSKAERAADAAWAGLCGELVSRNRSLTLGGISAPSVPGPRAMYRFTPRFAGLAYGVGAFCMLAAELSRHATEGAGS